MSREFLENLGILLPMFPTTSVGSLPKTDALTELRRQAARESVSLATVEHAEREAISFWIKKQEEIGMDILVDGEQLAGDRLGDMTAALEGFEPGGLVRLHGNRYTRRPIIVSGIRWTGPVTVDRWSFAQSLTSRPVKAILPGPCTLADWSFSDYYPDMASACKALADALRFEIEALVSAGARIIQLDEPVLAYRPNLLDLASETFERMLHEQSAYIILHVCTGRFDALYPGLLGLPVHQLDLEAAHGRADILEALRRDVPTKDIGLGVIDVQNRRIEEFRIVRDRLRRAAAVIPSKSLWVDPDCGLKNRTIDEAIAKLRVMAEVAKSLREAHSRRT